MSNTKNINSIKYTYIDPRPGVKYQFADFTLCTKQNILLQGDELIPLNMKATQCLILLVTNANKIVPRESFFNHVWKGCCVEEGVLPVNISYLRKILGKNTIKTYSRKGYIFNETVKVIEDKSYSSETKLTSGNNNPNQKTTKSFLDRIKKVLSVYFKGFLTVKH